MELIKKKYGELQLVDNKWQITNLEPHVCIKLKNVFTRIPSHAAKVFTLQNTPDVAADLLWFIDRYPLKISSDADFQELQRQNNEFWTVQRMSEALLVPDYVPSEREGLLPGQVLRSYQRLAIDFVQLNKKVLVVYDVGLGKSYIGLGIALIQGILPIAIVMEPHLQEQWYEKAISFLGLSFHKVKGNTPYQLPSSDVYLFKYSQLAPWIDVLCAGWLNGIIYDEVQQLRTGEEKSNKNAAAAQINRIIPVVVGMTATLIYNYGIEAYNIVNSIKPGALGTIQEFQREWCVKEPGQSSSKGIVADPDALGAYLRECNILIRKTKADVGQESKQLAPHVEWLEPNLKAVAEMEKLAEKLAIKALTGTFNERGQAARDFDLKMRELTGIAKAHAVAAYVRMFIESGTPVLLFGWHHSVYEIWAKELSDLNPLFYTGSETATQKERNKKAFINGESNLLIMSLRSGAGADGIQYRCSTVIFGEEDWSPQVIEQDVGRLDRDGQKEEVFVFHAVTNYGSDPLMLSMLGLKAEQARGIQDPGSTVIEKQADVDRIKILAAQYLKSKGIAIPEAKSLAERAEELTALKELI
ncbi:DEAD/DEAH box helicase [Vibrio cholerae]|uniref:ATP-dependent helicase n=1 Tax=Vibrio cholerae TaxID=666 RepID=UPI0012EBA73E|nr:ATP-dependent helicase [Vibrio cholerae]MDX5049784.1 hypothetical protein [Vibrio cholerae]MVC39534.1 ATP-dependent helicase [Vibrio cholerae]